jgi:hypothetical protein
MKANCYFCEREVQVEDPPGVSLTIHFIKQPEDGSVRLHLDVYACPECFHKLRPVRQVTRSTR